MDSEGIKLDEGKLRWDLLPWDALSEVVAVMTCALKDYDPENWRKVEPFRRRYLAAACRHLSARIRGEKYDSKSEKLHLAHVAACILFLIVDDLDPNRKQPPYLEPPDVHRP